jgi:cholest-4-en-3-one 26-monooxygenase
MPTTPASLADVNLWDKDRFVQGVPHEWFERMRREAPVAWHEGDPDFDGPQGGAGPFWAVTGYDEVVTVNRDNATFSSAERLVFMWDPEEANLEQQRLLMLNMDPPLHTRYRRLINKGFTPRMVGELESTMRKRTREIIDKVADNGECDFVVDVASELPLQVIADLMGVPQEDRHKLFDWSNRMIGAEDPEYGVTQEMSQHASMELYAYAAQLADKKRADPKDDLISVLTTAEVYGERLSGVEIDLFFLLLSVAGNETTRNLISNGMVALLEHPEQLERIRKDRSLVPGAVEEMLRCASRFMQFGRSLMTDFLMGCQQISGCV